MFVFGYDLFHQTSPPMYSYKNVSQCKNFKQNLKNLLSDWLSHDTLTWMLCWSAFGLVVANLFLFIYLIETSDLWELMRKLCFRAFISVSVPLRFRVTGYKCCERLKSTVMFFNRCVAIYSNWFHLQSNTQRFSPNSAKVMNKSLTALLLREFRRRGFTGNERLRPTKHQDHAGDCEEGNKKERALFRPFYVSEKCLWFQTKNQITALTNRRSPQKSKWRMRLKYKKKQKKNRWIIIHMNE